jgi:hypothetical protein
MICGACIVCGFEFSITDEIRCPSCFPEEQPVASLSQLAADECCRRLDDLEAIEQWAREVNWLEEMFNPKLMRHAA